MRQEGLHEAESDEDDYEDVSDDSDDDVHSDDDDTPMSKLKTPVTSKAGTYLLVSPCCIRTC